MSKKLKKIFRAGVLCALVLLAGCDLFQSAGSEYTFVQMGDPQIGMSGYSNDLACFSRAVETINALQPDFVLVCGDMVDKADERSFADFNAARAALTMPSWCVPGNHDIGYTPDEPSLTLYRKHFGKDYYMFEHKGDTFVCANTQFWKKQVPGESEIHDQWFADTLAGVARNGRYLFVVFHYPLFVETPDEKEHMFNLPADKRKELLRLCSSSSVDAVLAGHAHRSFTNEYDGIQLVNSETTSINTDKRPHGFRLWRVSPDGICHEFIPVE